MIDFPFWPSKEQTLVLEVFPNATSGLLLSCDEERRIRVKHAWDRLDPRTLPKFLRRFRRGNVVVSVDSTQALTATLPVKFDREGGKSREALSAVELENLLAQTIAKAWTERREEAIGALGVIERDAILVGSRVSRFTVDGHEVIDPVGFEGRRLEAVLELTLTTREIFERVKWFFEGSDYFFFTESVRAEARVLGRAMNSSLGILAVRPSKTLWFTIAKAGAGDLIRRGEAEWDARGVIGAFQAEFAVSEPVAFDLYRRAMEEGRSSKGFAAFAKKMLRPEIQSLRRAIGRTPLKGKVFVDSTMPLPLLLPAKLGRATLDEAPLGFLLSSLGFTIEDAEFAERTDAFRQLAPFLEYFLEEGESPINRKLRRHLHWLAS